MFHPLQIFDEVWSEAMDIFQDPDEIRIRESVRQAVRDGRPSRGETRGRIYLNSVFRIKDTVLLLSLQKINDTSYNS